VLSRTIVSIFVGALAIFSDAGSAAGFETLDASVKAETAAELNRVLLDREANADRFRARGPFAVAVSEDREVRLSIGERIKVDLFLSSPAEKAPLVIFVHGYDSTKRAHAHQAAHVASWGMHAVAVQLAGDGPWDVNGATLAKLVHFVRRSPEAIERRIDASRIILVGHSFGAYAVTVALAAGAPATGAILLDPAGIGKDLTSILRRISKPVMVLGADDAIDIPRNRDYFYEFIRRRVAEVSIRDAVHEDAQYPTEAALRSGGVDPHVTEALQVTFASAIVATAISLSATNGLEYAWASFEPLIEAGKLFNPKKK
jgi:pimeloyl-ACP methyl ester carboxylesterase